MNFFWRTSDPEQQRSKISWVKSPKPTLLRNFESSAIANIVPSDPAALWYFVWENQTMNLKPKTCWKNKFCGEKQNKSRKNFDCRQSHTFSHILLLFLKQLRPLRSNLKYIFTRIVLELLKLYNFGEQSISSFQGKSKCQRTQYLGNIYFRKLEFLVRFLRHCTFSSIFDFVCRHFEWNM